MEKRARGKLYRNKPILEGFLAGDTHFVFGPYRTICWLREKVTIPRPMVVEDVQIYTSQTSKFSFPPGSYIRKRYVIFM